MRYFPETGTCDKCGMIRKVSLLGATDQYKLCKKCWDKWDTKFKSIYKSKLKAVVNWQVIWKKEFLAWCKRGR